MSEFELADRLLMVSAPSYDLASRSDRKRSAKELVNLFLRMNARIQPRATFEIGAREAYFSRCIQRDVPTAASFAFEANPHNYEMFGPGALGAGVDYRHLAITDRSGPVSFMLQKTRRGKPVGPNVGNNSLLQLRTTPAEYEEVTVEGSSLADFVRKEKLTGPFSAWIDVEGAIGLVLTGVDDVLAEFHIIMCEVEDRENWQDQWLVSNVHNHLTQKGFIPVARDYEYAHQHNIIYCQKDVWISIRDLVAEHLSIISRPLRSQLAENRAG